MAISRLSWKLRTPAGAKSRWLGLTAVIKDVESNNSVVLIFLPRLAAFFAILLLGAYLSIAQVITQSFQSRPFSTVVFTDVALPWNWSEMHKKLGTALIQEGLADIRAQRIQPAYFKLKAGLRKVPESIEGRRALAEIHIAVRSVTEALDALVKGIEIGKPDMGYLALFFEAAKISEAYDLAAQKAQLLLKRKIYAEDSPENEFILQRYIEALRLGRRFEEGLVAIEPINAGEVPRALDVMVFFLMELDRYGEARRVLDKYDEMLNRDARFIELRAALELRTGNYPAAEPHISKRISYFPSDPAGIRFAIRSKLKFRLVDQAAADLKSYLERFSTNHEAMTQLAVELAEEPDGVSLLEKLSNEARDIGLPRSPYLLALIQSYIRDGAWEKAQTGFDEWKAIPANSDAKSAPIRDWLGGIVAAGYDKSSASANFVAAQLNRSSYPLSFHMHTAAVLKKIGHPETARDILKAVSLRYTYCKRAQEAFQEISGVLAKASSEKPTTTLTSVEVARSELKDETPRGFIEKVERQLGEGQWFEARRLLDLAIREKPEWNRQHGEKLGWLRLKAATESRDSTDLYVAAKRYLGSHHNRCESLMKHVEQLANEGRSEDAVIVARVILSEFEKFDAAQAFVAEMNSRTRGVNGTLMNYAAAPTIPDDFDALSSSSLSKVSKILDAGHWDLAELMIASIRRGNAPWLRSRLLDLEILGLRLMLGRGDQIAASVPISRILLDYREAGANRILELAQKADAAGRVEETRFLVDRVLMRVKFDQLKNPWLKEFFARRKTAPSQPDAASAPQK